MKTVLVEDDDKVKQVSASSPGSQNMVETLDDKGEKGPLGHSFTPEGSQEPVVTVDTDDEAPSNFTQGSQEVDVDDKDDQTMVVTIDDEDDRASVSNFNHIWK